MFRYIELCQETIELHGQQMICLLPTAHTVEIGHAQTDKVSIIPVAVVLTKLVLPITGFAIACAVDDKI